MNINETRGDDQTALPHADGRKEVHHARRERFGGGFEADPPGRIDRSEFVPVATAVFFRVAALDLGNGSEARTLSAARRSPMATRP